MDGTPIVYRAIGCSASRKRLADLSFRNVFRLQRFQEHKPSPEFRIITPRRSSAKTLCEYRVSIRKLPSFFRNFNVKICVFRSHVRRSSSTFDSFCENNFSKIYIDTNNRVLRMCVIGLLVFTETRMNICDTEL